MTARITTTRAGARAPLPSVPTLFAPVAALLGACAEIPEEFDISPVDGACTHASADASGALDACCTACVQVADTIVSQIGWYADGAMLWRILCVVLLVVTIPLFGSIALRLGEKQRSFSLLAKLGVPAGVTLIGLVLAFALEPLVLKEQLGSLLGADAAIRGLGVAGVIPDSGVGSTLHCPDAVRERAMGNECVAALDAYRGAFRSFEGVEVAPGETQGLRDAQYKDITDFLGISEVPAPPVAGQVYGSADAVANADAFVDQVLKARLSLLYGRTFAFLGAAAGGWVLLVAIAGLIGSLAQQSHKARLAKGA